MGGASAVNYEMVEDSEKVSDTAKNLEIEDLHYGDI
jgi:hypothetical protein